MTVSDVHDLTDRLAKQIETLLDDIGEKNTSIPGSATDICDSLSLILDDLVYGGQDKTLQNEFAPAVENLETRLSAVAFVKSLYSGIIGSLERYLATGVRNGFYDFAVSNTAVRYASPLVRMLEQMGFSIVSPIFMFYTGTDILGTVVLDSATTGTYTASTFDWGTATSDYGVQPSTGLVLEAKTAINAGSDLTIIVTAREAINDSLVQLTGTLSAGDPIGTQVALENGTIYEDYVYEVTDVQITDGTAADEVYIRFAPLRTIALE